jgi:tetratricopeptide (TPR) repeat protein
MTMRSVIPVLLLVCAGWASAGETADAYQASNDLEVAGQYREALEAMDGVAAADRGEYTYHLRCGWLHYLSGDHRASVAAYGRAVVAQPRAVEPRLGLMLPQMALHLWRDAEQTAGDTLALDPKNYLAGSRRAWALYNLGRYDEAEVAYRRVLELYPADVDMRSGLGWCLLKLDRPVDAATQFRTVLRVAPTDPTALEGLANSGG